MSQWSGLKYAQWVETQQRIDAEGNSLDETAPTPPHASALKYRPHFEELYPEDDDGVEEEGTDLDEELKPL